MCHLRKCRTSLQVSSCRISLCSWLTAADGFPSLAPSSHTKNTLLAFFVFWRIYAENSLCSFLLPNHYSNIHSKEILCKWWWAYIELPHLCILTAWWKELKKLLDRVVKWRFFFFVKKTWSFGMQVLDLFIHIPSRSTLRPSDNMWGKFTGPKLWKQYILAVFRTGSLGKLVSYMKKQKKNQENVMFSKAWRTFFHLFFPWHVTASVTDI